jgi:hypothetical protein
LLLLPADNFIHFANGTKGAPAMKHDDLLTVPAEGDVEADFRAFVAAASREHDDDEGDWERTLDFPDEGRAAWRELVAASIEAVFAEAGIEHRARVRAMGK